MYEAIYKLFSKPGCTEITEILSYAIEYAEQKFHTTLTIEHIVYGFLYFCQASAEKPCYNGHGSYDYTQFPWYVKPTSYEIISRTLRTSPQKEKRKNAPLTTNLDVTLLSENYKRYFSNCPKYLTVETFYHLIAFLNEQKEFDKIYIVPYPQDYKVKNFYDFIKTPEAHRNLAQIKMSVQDNSPKTSEGEIMSASNYRNDSFFSSPLKIDGTTDITYNAFKGRYPDIVGRKTELLRLTDILSKMKKNNAVLIGNPGVGKTALVEAFALRIVNEDVPQSLKYSRILELDLSSAIAGSKYRGDFEEKIQKIFDLIKKSAEKVILYIDEIHSTINLGSASENDSLSLSDMLKPFSLNSNVKIIGTSTFKDYKKFEKDKALERRFETIIVEEPSFEETLTILNFLKPRLERTHKVKILAETMDAAINFSRRYIPEHYLPDKAIDVLDEACAIKANSSKTNDSKTTILPEDILVCISRKKNIPLNKIQQSYSLESFEEHLSSKVIGQSHVISILSRAIRRAQVGLNDEKRPLASFMFIGPTGVGKTEIAKTLADIMFTGHDSLIRFDMSEYMEEHSVSKLIGSPPGYIGYEDAGLLTEQVRRHPYSLVLFDEFEKAHHKIANLLLQILDDGILTDSHGDTIDFKNTIIILTSNVGVREHTKNSIGFGEQSNTHSHDVIKTVKNKFSPEFLNRLDEIVLFNSLSEEDIFKIAEIYISTDIVDKLKEKGIHITISDDVIRELAKRGYSHEYGARELKRTITRELKNPLADFILQNSNEKRISVTLSESQIKITSNQAVFA